jgi:hypothetical protein
MLKCDLNAIINKEDNILYLPTGADRLAVEEQNIKNFSF